MFVEDDALKFKQTIAKITQFAYHQMVEQVRDVLPFQFEYHSTMFVLHSSELEVRVH